MKKTKKNKNTFKNRKFKLLAIFLMLSVIFWLLSKLSKEYTHTLKFKTQFINISNEKILHNKPIDNIYLTIKSHGFKLLNYNFRNPKIKIDLKLVKKIKNGNYYYLTNKHFGEIQSQLSTETTLIAVKPDSIFFDFGDLISKKVIVKPALSINYKNGYNLTKQLIVSPDSIVISGSKKQIDSIIYVSNDKLTLNNIYKNFKKNIVLKTLNKINYSSNKITVSGNVEKITEGSLTLNYNLINVPDGLNISSFTKNVNLTYNVSLINFDKVKKSDFEIVCDYSLTQKDSLSYLIPRLIKKSPFVSNIKINPNKITYLIKKQ